MACFEDACRAKARSVFYRYGVIGTSEIRFGDIKAVAFKEKNQAKPISSNPAIKHLLLQRLMLFSANSAAKTTILMPSAVQEPHSSQTIRTGLILVLRPMVG